MSKAKPRILWNAKDHPSLPSGYGVVGQGLLPRLAKQYGEENILIYAPVYQRDGVGEWRGMKVLPGQSFDFGENLIESHWLNHNPTFLLQVGDWFPLQTIPKLAAEDRLVWVQWCLGSGTIIETPSGPVTIEQVRPGMQVLARSQEGIVWADVQATQKIPYGQELLTIEMEDGSFVEATPDHLMYTPHGWQQCDTLHPGDSILAHDSKVLDSRGRGQPDCFSGKWDSAERSLRKIRADLHSSGGQISEAEARATCKISESAAISSSSLERRRGQPAQEIIPEWAASRDNTSSRSWVDGHLLSRQRIRDSETSNNKKKHILCAKSEKHNLGLYSRNCRRRRDNILECRGTEYVHNHAFGKRSKYIESLDGLAVNNVGLSICTWEGGDRQSAARVSASDSRVSSQRAIGTTCALSQDQTQTRRNSCKLHNQPVDKAHEGTIRQDGIGDVLGGEGTELTWRLIRRVSKTGESATFVYDLTTSTGNFFANGLLSHNCPYDFLKVPDTLVQNVLKFAFKVVPWNAYSEGKLRGHGLTNVTQPIPLGVDTSIWTPMDRRELPRVMASLGFDENSYNILLVGANQRRKYLYEQLEGVNLFRKTNLDKPIRLYLHTHSAGDLDIHAVVRECGLEDVTVYPDQYTYALGGLTEAEMVKVFNCADVVLNVCLEGMGLAQIQAQALGVPVITLGEGPGPEIVTFGAEVGHMGVDYTYMALKPIPDPVSIAQALESVWPWRGKRDEKASAHIGKTYSWDVIADQWFALIEEIMFERDKFSLYKPTPGSRLRRLARETIEVS